MSLEEVLLGKSLPQAKKKSDESLENRRMTNHRRGSEGVELCLLREVEIRTPLLSDQGVEIPLVRREDQS